MNTTPTAILGSLTSAQTNSGHPIWTILCQKAIQN